VSVPFHKNTILGAIKKDDEFGLQLGIQAHVFRNKRHVSQVRTREEEFHIPKL
jgi:hypothetical protein